MSARAVPHEGLVLAIDAAPGVGSVALLRAGVVVGARAVAMRAAAKPTAAEPAVGVWPPPDDDPLARAIDVTLRTAHVTPAELAGVACGAGPGGFTSLRIAAALAKGLAHATGCVLLAGPSLAWAAAVRAPAAGVWLVTLDALRGERYVARVEVGEVVGATRGDPRSGRDVLAYAYLGVHASGAVSALAALQRAAGTLDVDGDAAAPPIAAGAAALPSVAVDLASWEPAYGRLAEAQARWEATHGPLPPAEAAG